MRNALSVALLMVAVSIAHAQTPTPAFPVQPPVPAQAPVQQQSTTEPATPRPEVPARSQASAHVEAAADAEPVAIQERRRSRVIWFLLGAVAVLAIILIAQ